MNSNFPNFKPIKLKTGVNIILAQRVNNTTNGVGKSLFLESIDYVLGSDYNKSELAKYPDLEGFSITLIMDFEGSLIEVSRKISIITKENNYVSIQGKSPLPVTQWKQRLMEHYFSVEQGPSFFSWRSLLHFFFKTQSINSFEAGLKSFSGDPDYKTSAFQSFLLNIAYDEIKELSQATMLNSEKAGFTRYINSLKKTVKLLPKIIPENIDSYSEVNNILEKEINSVKLDVTTLQNKIDFLSIQKDQLLKTSNELERSSDSSAHFSSLYHILDAELGDFVMKTFEESKEFNKALLQENATVVNEELSKIQDRLNISKKEQELAKNQLKSILDTKKHQKDSIEQIDISSILLQGLINNPSTAVSAKIENGITDLTETNLEKIKININKKQDDIKSYEKILELIVNYVYDASRDVHFGIEFEKSLKVDFYYEDDSGTGKGNMKTIIYYLFLLELNNVEFKRNIDFLILDTDITDGIDSNNIYRFLEFADSKLKKFNGQLIMTMKDDRDIPFDTIENKNWIRKKLFDSPGGYLFKEQLSKKRKKK